MAVRRVRRVIRKFDPWTVLKVSLIFNVIAALVFVLGMWVMWSIAVQRGIPDRVADLLASLTIVFNPDGTLYFRVVVLMSIVWAVMATGIMTLAAVLYNLISDVVGGVEVLVLEETYQTGAAGTQPGQNQTGQTRVRPAVHRTDNGPGLGPASGDETQPHPVASAVGDS